MRRSDRITSLVLLCVCVYAWITADRFSPLSALFPRVLVIVLAGLSLLLLIMSFVKPPQGKAFDYHGGGLPVALTGVMMVAWVALIGLFGFLSTSLVFFTLMAVTLDRRERTTIQTIRRIVVVWIVTMGFYLFFDRVLMVLLPRGVFI